MINEREKEVDKIIATTTKGFESTIEFAKKDIEKIADNISKEYKETRIMIKTKYDLFGRAMVILTALISGLFVHSIVTL